MHASTGTPSFDRFYVDGLYCSLHRAAPGKRRGVCVVFSAPMGRDARWTYRAMVIFAAQLAGEGFDVVRFDPAGEGDSAEAPLDADQWALWTSGLARVAAEARRLTGATRSVLLGIRIGATIARAAAREASADGLVLLDPLASGKAWVSELNILRAMFIEPPPPESAVEALGLRISHATKAALEAVDLAALPPLNVPCLYASPIKNQRVLQALGPKAETIPFKGYASFFKEGHVNEYPDWTFGQIRDWLAQTFKPGASLGAQAEPTETRLAGDGFVEEPVTFGAGHVGILTLPTDGDARSAVLIGNTGADPRAGTGNFAALMARRLARRGVATLRIDFEGLGESDPALGHRSPVYEQSRTETFRAGADLLCARGFGDPALIGVCTGGYHAVQALIDDRRFSKVLSVNSWLLFRPGAPLERESFLRALRSKFMDAQPELAARVDPLIDTARALIPSRGAGPAAAGGEASAEQVFEIEPIAQTALDRLDAALRAGQSICLLMGHRDPSRSGLDYFGDEGLQRLADSGLTQQFEQIDHGLFSLDSQKITLDRIYDFLNRPS